MKKFKYFVVLLMWIAIKLLAIFLCLKVFSLFAILTDEGSPWWSWVLAYLPSIVIWFLTISVWIYDAYNRISESIDADTGMGAVFLFILTLIPPLLIDIVLLALSFCCFEFPHKDTLRDIDEVGIIKSFINLYKW